MKKEIFEIRGITCFAYEEKKPEYLIIQPINEPHAQMLDHQVQFMINNTEKGFFLIAFLVKNWNHDLSPWSGTRETISGMQMCGAVKGLCGVWKSWGYEKIFVK